MFVNICLLTPFPPMILDVCQYLSADPFSVLFRIRAGGELTVESPKSGSYAVGDQLIALVIDPTEKAES